MGSIALTPVAAFLGAGGGGSGDGSATGETGGDATGDGSGGGPGRIAVVGIVVLLVLGAVGWFFRPYLHWLLYTLPVTSPQVVYWVAIGGAVGLGGLLWEPLVGDDEGGTSLVAQGLFYLGVALVVYGVVVSSFVSGAYAQQDLANDLTRDAERTDSFVRMDPERPRILPAQVATRYGETSFRQPQYRMGTRDITFVRDESGTYEPTWSYTVVPDSLGAAVTRKQRGGLFVDMTTKAQREPRKINTTFDCGEGMLFTDDYQFQLRKGKMGAEYSDPFVVPHDGSVVMAVPYVVHEVRFRFLPVPQPYSVPKFGGVAIVTPDCEVSYLSPEAARESDVLEGQVFYPYDLARYRVQSLAFRQGMLNAYVFKEGVPQVADPAAFNNSPPYTVPTRDGVAEYAIPTQPAGEGTGVFQMWYVNGRTGQPTVYEPEGQVIGADGAADKVVSANPRVGWQNLRVVEAVPVGHDGGDYWKLHVVPNGGGDLSYTAFVDASTGEVFRYPDDERTVAFLAGEKPPQGADRIDPTKGGDGGEVAPTKLVIVVRNPDGSVARRIRVSVNQSIEIESSREGNETAGNGSGGNRSAVADDPATAPRSPPVRVEGTAPGRTPPARARGS